MASFGQVSFQTTSPHPNSGFGAATFCNQQETWQRDRGRSALPQQLKAAALHNDTAVLYGNRTTQPTTPSCKLKLVLWKTETRHTPDGYAGMSHVHNGSLLEFNYRTGAGKIIKKKKVPELLQWWKVECPMGGASVPCDSFVIALNEQCELQTWREMKDKPTAKCNNKTNVTVTASEWQIGYTNQAL